MDMIKHLRQTKSKDKAKMATEILGNKQGDKSSWLRDVINVRRKLQGKIPLTRNHGNADHLTVKANALDILVSYLESDL